MINTRVTIFKTLLKRIRELTKHANYAPKEFKKIILAVILNDLKEWSEYIPKDDPQAIVDLLETFLMNNCFIADRIQEEGYYNVNTPQTNETWGDVTPSEDGEIIPTIVPEEACTPWKLDGNYKRKLVYFTLPVGVTGIQYLRNTYGFYGQKLKTVHEKMDIYINKETGEGWYLDEDCGGWKNLLNNSTNEPDLSNYKIHHSWSNDGSEIELSLVKNGGQVVADNTIDVLTTNDIDDIV